jgi:hypothetical protein
MSKRVKRIIAMAVFLVGGGTLVPYSVANELESFRPCASDGILYDPSTDDFAVYYSPIGKYIVFPSAGQLRYLGRLREPDYSPVFGNYGGPGPIDSQWRLDTANKVKELRTTGICKNTAGG